MFFSNTTLISKENIHKNLQTQQQTTTTKKNQSTKQKLQKVKRARILPKVAKVKTE